MTPKEVQALFSGACPELTWVIDGDYVVAQELPPETIRVFWGPAPTAAMWPKANMLRILRRDGGIHTLHPDDTDIAESIAMVVDVVLCANTPAREYLGVRRLCARVRVQARREFLHHLEELLTQRSDELTRRNDELARAIAKQRHAQAVVRKATRVVHGLRKDIKKEQARLAEAEAEAARLAAPGVAK